MVDSRRWRRPPTSALLIFVVLVSLLFFSWRLSKGQSAGSRTEFEFNVSYNASTAAEDPWGRILENDNSDLVEVDGPEGVCILEGCDASYYRRVQAVSEKAGRNVKRMLCGEAAREMRANRPVGNISKKRIIIGVGQGTTGTQTLAYGLSFLGLKVLHFQQHWHPFGVMHDSDRSTFITTGASQFFGQVSNREFEECHRGLDRLDGTLKDDRDIDALFDVPSANFGWDLLRGYPNAHIILSLREPRSWAASRLHHAISAPPYQRPCDRDFLANYTEEGAAEVFDANNQYWICRIPREKLTLVNVFEENSPTIWTKLIIAAGQNVNWTLIENCDFPKVSPWYQNQYNPEFDGLNCSS
mmetsp:Transcript_12169/g.24827  ORF Transcript_12169/g.24827 Transcript_12169/m.24827 type:complete len:356 (-) Transcript_12169:751-1818(-)